MEKFNLNDRYRLELHWDSVSYNCPGICEIKNAIFKGPALIEALKLNDNDHIMLDFFSQYILLVKSVYVAKFSWGQVSYNSDGTISLKDAIISHDAELNRVPKLNDDDFLIIDTSDHEVENHKFSLLYKTYVVNRDTNLYKFRR